PVHELFATFLNGFPALIQQIFMPLRHGNSIGLGAQVFPNSLHNLKLLAKWKLLHVCNAHITFTIRCRLRTDNIFGERSGSGAPGRWPRKNSKAQSAVACTQWLSSGLIINGREERRR